MKPKWLRIQLDEKETQEIIEKAIEINRKIYENILEKERKTVRGRTKEELIASVNAIFEKCGIPTFVLLKEKLEEKCAKIREGENDKKVFAV